jgi:hypothetical protein
MAKKSRRARVTAKPNTAAPQTGNAPQPQAQSTIATRRSARQPVAPAVNIMQSGHYEYVKEDLIRIGIISAVLILILVVLTFIPALKS